MRILRGLRRQLWWWQQRRRRRRHARQIAGLLEICDRLQARHQEMLAAIDRLREKLG